MIYLDNAATTMRKPPAVIEAVVNALQTAGNAARGAHEEALKASRAVFDTRMKLAKLFHAHPERVIFTCNATESLNIALNGIFKAGDHVITTDLEHNSVLRPLYRLEAEGIISLDFVPADRKGCIDIEDFARRTRPETRAYVSTHASNLTGNGVDVAAIGALAKKESEKREEKILFVVDASQSAGCLPIDMEEMGIDVLCTTGHKGLMGPQGTGCLCLHEGVEIRPFKVGGSGVQSYSKTQPEDYPTRLEAGTLNSHGIAGLSAALDFIETTGIEAIHEHEMKLCRRFLEGVEDIPGMKVYGDFSTDYRTAVVALNCADEDSALVADELAYTYGIATRAGAHCAPRMHQALGNTEQGAVRFSFAWYNTEEEVDQAIAALKELMS